VPVERIILDLCGGTGSWSDPYRRAGYDVRVVTLPQDVRDYSPPASVHGILAAPPCTDFAVSGARWWASKPPPDLSIVRACLSIVEETGPKWWALENPVGRLRQFIGAPGYSFQPWEFGDPWFKRTCIWGSHSRPLPTCTTAPEKTGERWRSPLTNHLSPKPTAEQIAKLVKTGMIPPDWIHRLGPSPERATLRSITPPGFARAFFEANR
jgi:hypothetical protein